MADDLSLLFKIRGDAAGAKQATAETRAAVAQLKTSLGTEFNSIQSAGQKALAGIGDNLNTFVGARVPLIGGAFLRVSDSLKGVGAETKKADADIAKFSKTLDGLSTTTGKSKSSLTSFLTSFVQLETQAKRDTAVIETFGAAAAQKLIPQLEQAGAEMSTLATNAGAVGSSIGAAVPIIGVAAVALIALHVAAVAVVQKFLELTVSTAEWQGKLHDLSQQTEVSVETLSTLDAAFRMTGGSIDTASNALIIFQTKLADAQDPVSETAERFEALGITATDTETAFRQALKAVAALPDSVERVNTAAELFGRRGAKQLLAAINETGGDLDKLTQKLKAAGVLLEGDVSRAADEFNDQLVIVQLQLRALTAQLVTDSIPKILAALRETSKIIAENKDSIEIVGKAIGVFVSGNVYGVLLPALRVVATTLKEIETAWNGVRRAAEVAVLVAAGVSAEEALRLVNAREAAANRPSPGESESGLSSDLTSRREIKESQERIKQAKFEAEEQARISADRLAQAERDYQQGRITREKERDIKISALKAEKDAKLAAFQAEEVLKQQVMASRLFDAAEQRKLAEDIDKIRQNARNLQSETNRKITEEEQKAQQDRAKAFIEYSNNAISLRRKHAENEIAIVEARIKANEIAEEAGAKEIAVIQNRVFGERRKTLNDQLASAVIGGLSKEQRDSIIQQRKELNLEITAEEKKQAERLKQIKREEFEFERSLLLARLDAQVRLGSIRDNAQIASLRALGALRVRTEEEIERAILKIRLDAIDRESAAIKARQTALGGITDPKARKAEQERLNAELEANKAEREALEAEGERDVQSGIDRDIARRRRHAADIRSIDDELRAGELDRRRRELELLAQREGLNAETIALFRQLTLDEEAERHKRIVGEIDAQEAEAHAIDVGGKNKLEIEQKYNELREQENQRFHDRQTEINKPGGADVSGSNAPGAFDQLRTAIDENLDGATLTAARAGIEALSGAFQGLGQAIGAVVEAWVLYGSAGTSVRKVTAQILAGIAQQAAVKAVFELAEGFAALAMAFFGVPNAGPSASAHFIAAGIYAGIAGVAAIAGRAVAGDAFKQKSETGSSGSSRESTQPARRSNEPIDINRRVGSQAQAQVITHELVYKVKGDAVIDEFVRDYDLNGRTRVIIRSDGQG